MKSKTTLNLFVLLFAVTASGFASATETLYVKDDNQAVTLVVRDNGLATITHKDAKGEVSSLIIGKVERVANSADFKILPESAEDPCPAVKVELLHDASLGEQGAATVSNIFADATIEKSLRQLCDGINLIDGSYSLKK